MLGVLDIYQRPRSTRLTHFKLVCFRGTQSQSLASRQKLHLYLQIHRMSHRLVRRSLGNSLCFCACFLLRSPLRAINSI